MNSYFSTPENVANCMVEITNIFALYGWNALKGQKLLAQGNALGIKAVSKAPCKGKSFKNPCN